MIKAIIFDMDGVLIDSHDAWLSRFNAALDNFGFKKIGSAEFDKYVWSINFIETAGKYFPGVKIGDIREFFQEQFKSFVDDVEEIPNAVSSVKAISDMGYTLAVASNTQSAVVKKILERMGISGQFKVIIGGEMVKNGKPNPEILFKSLKKLKMQPNEAVFVGDTIYDRQAAEKAKIRFIGYKISGDEKIQDLKQLPEVIKNACS